MVRRRYLVALFVVAIAAVAYTVVPPEIHKLKVQASRHGLAKAITAIDAVTVPHGFDLITSANCGWYRCFYVGKPTWQVAPSLLGIIGRMGINTAQLTATMERQQADADKQLRKWGLPVHRSKAPLGCGVLANPRLGPITDCALSATLDGHVVVLFLGPYFLSRYSGTKHLTLTAEDNALKHASEIDIALDCGYGSAPSQMQTANYACFD
jgi:phage-related holin